MHTDTNIFKYSVRISYFCVCQFVQSGFLAGGFMAHWWPDYGDSLY